MHVKVGLLFSLTGTTSITEKGQCDAARYALQKYETETDSITTIIRDIQSDPIRTKEEAEALAKAGVKIFIGCYTSACRKAVLPILEKYDCLLVYPALYEGQECHPNVFYTGEVPNQQVHTLLEYGTRHYGKSVYAIGTDYIYPRETNRQVKTFLKEKGGALIGERYVPFGDRAFFDILQDIILTKPDIIFSTLVGKSIIPFYQTYKRMGLHFNDVPIFSPITKETEIEVMGSEYGEGHYSSASYFQSLPSEANRDFVRDFQQFTGKEHPVSSVMFNTYLGTQIVMDSVFTTKSENHREIIYFLSGQHFNTLCGKIIADPNHRHLSRPVKIGRVSNTGQFETVWDSEKEITPLPFKVKGKPSAPLHELVLNAWGEISDEALLVLSDKGRIVYLSQKAKVMTDWCEGEFVTNKMMKSAAHVFEVKKYPAKYQNLYILKAIKNQSRNENPFIFGNIKTVNKEYQSELEVGTIASQSTANVLILGETGTGKEMIAQAIHKKSERREGPFISVNTGLLPKDLIASELFGFVEGAFTGARKGGAIGKFEAANNGTLFLDEIGDMPLELQIVLLRAIEAKRIVRLGDTRERPINARIIAATNRDLEEEIAYGGNFRSDLYYRLNVLSLTIPPLRERPEDIQHLCESFLKQFQDLYGDGPESLEQEALQLLVSYHWPGNIRELRNALERAFLLARKERTLINQSHFPKAFQGYTQRNSNSSLSLKRLEKQAISDALTQTRTTTEAAAMLGIARSTLYRKIKEHQLPIN